MKKNLSDTMKSPLIGMINDLIYREKSNNKISDSLELVPVKLDEAYAKKWKANMTYHHLYHNGKQLRDTLYGVGGLGAKLSGKYFLLLKYSEAFYSENITKHTGSDPRHLEGCWCILDEDGNEKVNFEYYANPYLISNSCIYTIDHRYFNIESGEKYCQAYDRMETSEFLFLNNAYDDDVKKRGVMKINKLDGSFELFPK